MEGHVEELGDEEGDVVEEGAEGAGFFVGGEEFDDDRGDRWG